MNDKIKNPLIQTMENPIWKSDHQGEEKTKSKKLILKTAILFLVLILLLLVAALFLSGMKKNNNQVKKEEEAALVISPTLIPAPKSSYQEAIDEAEKDLESLDLFDESFYPPLIENIFL